MNRRGEFSKGLTDTLYDMNWPAPQYHTTSTSRLMVDTGHSTGQGVDRDNGRAGATSLDHSVDRLVSGINDNSWSTPLSSSPTSIDSLQEDNLTSSSIFDTDDFAYRDHWLEDEECSPPFATSSALRSDAEANHAQLRSFDRLVRGDGVRPWLDKSPSVVQADSGHVSPWQLDQSFVYPSPWSPRAPCWPVQADTTLLPGGQFSESSDASSLGPSVTASGLTSNLYNAQDQLSTSGSTDRSSNIFMSPREDTINRLRKPQANLSKPRDTFAQPRRHTERRICHICERAGVKSKISFKGQHEFARHNNKRHSGDKKQWICLDPTPDKRHSWCKKCRDGKLYAVNYNAAEHLRRAHLNPDGSEKLNKKVKGARRDVVDMTGDNGDRAQGHPRIQDMIRLGWLSSVYSSDNSVSPDMQKQYTESPAEAGRPWYNEQQQHMFNLAQLDPVFMMTGPTTDFCLDESQFDTPISDTSSILDAMTNAQKLPGWPPLGYAFDACQIPQAFPCDMWASVSQPSSDLGMEASAHIGQLSSRE